MNKTKQYLALDIGEVRIGLAMADSGVRIAVPYDTIAMNEESFRADIAQLVAEHNINTLVIGYPRNQSGEATKQTEYVEQMASRLEDIDAEVVFQDESLTSRMAEDRLTARGGAFTKGDIDAEAAAIILQDYLEGASR